MYTKHRIRQIAETVIDTIPVVFLFALAGCGSAGVSTPTTTNIIQNAGIQALVGEGCLKLAHSHPTQVSAGLEDLNKAQTALDTGKVPYAEILDLALTHVRVNAESMVVIRPALDAVEAQLGAGASAGSGKGKLTVPAKGSQAYAAIEAGIVGCRTGLIAAGG